MLLGLPLSAAVAATPSSSVEQSAAPSAALSATSSASWVVSWQASPQRVWESGFLFPTNLPATIQGQTIRQIARLSVGGHRARIVLSNAFGREPVFVGKTTLARVAPDGAALSDPPRQVTFGGKEAVLIPPGASWLSDAVEVPLRSLTQVAVSLYLPRPTHVETFHWDGRQTAWIAPGDQAAAISLTPANGPLLATTARPLLAGIQVDSDRPAQAVVVLGDSITDGATASVDRDTRWPDFLARRLCARGVAVANAGISGARLLSDGMGTNALARLDRDVLAQPGVRSVIVMLGINDIAWPGTAFARQARTPTLDELSDGYRQLVARSHARGVRVVAATLTPFAGALPGTPLEDYFNDHKDALRERVNDWIRHSGVFDAVVDFDAVLRDVDHPTRLAPAYDSGDHLHPGNEGNKAMADAVDLDMLLPTIGNDRAAASCPILSGR
ncbi:Lysophospholipase L1 [Chitinasiproducens palmae]|uniref:Lysophospholipase L1 n=2 Tax=Chitinasiproducens palmae TaxID=1770053 RepID=A0A1H2PKS3_9BURK|nr:Lysophospholipase L1 [Chitinasiproducens palmae]